jgi:hypothetical protein
MHRGVSGLVTIAALLCVAPNAHGQEATERFVPVGQSPGISARYSDVGRIRSADPEHMTVTVQGPARMTTIKVTERTRIWLDRSRQRLTNEVGTMADLQPGRRVEVKYVDHETKDRADWIKVVP